ncbi:MAG: hypothetical protein IKQ39_05170 [Oscillospiraceae bacterium]|nr:hypothetical protein [Oscillospiraceae bacterium]
MKNLKKTLAALFALTMAFGMVSCGDDSSSSTADSSSSAAASSDAGSADNSSESSADSGSSDASSEESSEPEAAPIETETYSVKKSDGATASIEWVKSDLYSVKEDSSGNGLMIIYGDDDATIRVQLKYDFPNQSNITKKETDFYGEFHDYAAITVGSYAGWEVYKGEANYEYQSEFIISEPDAAGKVYAIWIDVLKSSMIAEDKNFDMKDFVNSDEFNTFRNSAKVTNEVPA